MILGFHSHDHELSIHVRVVNQRELKIVYQKKLSLDRIQEARRCTCYDVFKCKLLYKRPFMNT